MKVVWKVDLSVVLMVVVKVVESVDWWGYLQRWDKVCGMGGG